MPSGMRVGAIFRRLGILGTTLFLDTHTAPQKHKKEGTKTKKGGRA
jgi:hypothetical protein